MNLKIGDKVVRNYNYLSNYYSKELSIDSEYEVERIEHYQGVNYIKLRYYLYPVDSIYLIKVL